MKSELSRLSGFEILRGVDQTCLEQLLARGEILQVDLGSVVIARSDRHLSMYMILDGELGVYLDSVEGDPVARLGPGQTVGELSILNQAVASANVVATAPTWLLEIDESVFWGMIAGSHEFATNLLFQLAQRLRANNNVVSDSTKLRRQFERAALFDNLTGVHNRRWFDATIDRFVQRCERSKEPLSIAVADVDHFKQFNDQYGHQAGDHVLASVARALSQGLRPTDLIARYGGEEFVIILPNTSIVGAKVATERLRRRVAQLQLQSLQGAELPRITISLGVAQFVLGQDSTTFFGRADQALYSAKQNGRNRVECAGDELKTADG